MNGYKWKYDAVFASALFCTGLLASTYSQVTTAQEQDYRSGSAVTSVLASSTQPLPSPQILPRPSPEPASTPRVATQAPTPALYTQTGSGMRLGGDLTLLQDHARNGLSLRVTLRTAHGDLTGVCDKPALLDDGTVRCEVQIPCEGGGEELEGRHIHRLDIRTQGYTEGMVEVPRRVGDGWEIWGAEGRPARIRWQLAD